VLGTGLEPDVPERLGHVQPRSIAQLIPQALLAMWPSRTCRDNLIVEGDRIEYHWTFTGTNTGPGGTGMAVRVSGFEEWTIDDDGPLEDGFV
jgi:hypothetical protein